jgi:hypothetical protein
VVIFDPLAGHGEDNSRLLADAGMVRLTRGPTSLRDTLSSAEFWKNGAPGLAIRARGLFDRPSPGEAVAALAGKQIAQPGHIRRLAPVVAISLGLGAWFIGENPPRGYDVGAPPKAAPTQPLEPARRYASARHDAVRIASSQASVVGHR